MKYLHALNKISGIGPQKTKILLSYFQTPKNAWVASKNQFLASGIGEKLSERIMVERSNINPDEEWEKLNKENIKIITPEDPVYPKLLNQIPNPPYLLYTKGSLDVNSSKSIAIVGSRKYTSYGAQIANSFARDLAKSGITIVSGMAIGIDSFAHRGALSGNGYTVAVLGNSLDSKSIYPRVNFSLSREIEDSGGMLLSEYPPETSAGPLTFPARNRIIAGVSLGTLVVEAGEKSGALITAKMALDFNREVFSIPGSLFSPASSGTNDLIKKGAKLVTNLSDILEELNIDQPENPTMSLKIPANALEEKLLKILSSDPIHIDIISKVSKLKTFEVSSALSVMEIKGWTKNIGGQNYIIL